MSNFTIPAWAEEQLRLRARLERWITEEIDRYDNEGFARLFGDRGGHALDEAGGYTRSFVSAYCLNGDERIDRFMKRFRDDWHEAVTAAGHFYHGYDSNEHGDYITHTAEAFTQFLLNVFYLDISDEKTVYMVEDAAEHLGNWSPEVQDWYDWDSSMFLSYFLGTRSPYHKPPYDFQSTRHFRVLTIATAAYEATRKARYLDLCRDYWASWSERILNTPKGGDVPMGFKLIGDDEIRHYASQKQIMADWRFHRYYGQELASLGLRADTEQASVVKPPFHIPHDLVMTMLDVLRFVPDDTDLREGLHQVMDCWIGWGTDSPSQIAGTEPHCGVHLPKYRDVTGDTSLDAAYLDRWPISSCSYLLTGDPRRLVGVAQEADAVFQQALTRNRGDVGDKFVCNHACNVISNAGTSSAYVMPSLFSPALGGLGVHYGRAPWLNVLYYSNGSLGLPGDVAALYIPAIDGDSPKVQLANTGPKPCSVAMRRIDPAVTTGLVLTKSQPGGLKEVICSPGQVAEATI